MVEQALATRPQNGAIQVSREPPTLPSTAEWSTLVEMASMLVPTGFLPNTINTPQKAVAIILKGRELRIPPMYALSNIVIVQGKPTSSAELMLALIYRDHGDDSIIVEESSSSACRVTYKRRAWDRRREFAFTIEDAQRANLAGKDIWRQYPQAMLRARCISAVARLAFPDSIAGMYTPEELDAAVRVTEDGVVEVDAPPPAAEPTGSEHATSPAPSPAATHSLLVQEALNLYHTLKAEGVEPEPPASRDATVLTDWIAAWKPKLDEKRAAVAAEKAAADAAIDARTTALKESLARAKETTQPGAAPASARTQEAPGATPAPAASTPPPATQSADEDPWEQLKREPPAPSGRRWEGTPLGREVSQVADQLIEAGKKFELPADDASDADLTGWLASKRGLLGQSKGGK